MGVDQIFEKEKHTLWRVNTSKIQHLGQKIPQKDIISSDVINRCQKLVELDLLIYPVPGFVSIRSLGAEI